MKGPKAFSRNKNNRVIDRAGLSTLVLSLALITALVGGVALGITAVSVLDEDGSGGIPLDNSSYSYLNSQIDQLKERISSLEMILENNTIPSGSLDNIGWPVDEIYASVKPSIVMIKVEKVTQGIFGSTTETVQGSGFVYNESGIILTNNHVIEGGDEVLVRFWNGETVEADMVGTDKYSDIGVLSVDPSELEIPLQALELADSGSLEPGDRVVSIGTPFGLTGTATTGIVSQTERVLNTETGYPIPGVIQIDAAINPGNSGGPLLNFGGEVIGITTAIQSQTGSFSGIGFVVPSNLVKKVSESLIENGLYKHPWIGVSGNDVTYEIAQDRGLSRVRGYIIKDIFPDSPAEEAGLREDDIILGIEDKEVMDIEDILSYIELEKSPGDTVSFDVLRDGNRITINLELGVRPST